MDGKLPCLFETSLRKRRNGLDGRRENRAISSLSGSALSLYLSVSLFLSSHRLLKPSGGVASLSIDLLSFPISGRTHSSEPLGPPRGRSVALGRQLTNRAEFTPSLNLQSENEQAAVIYRPRDDTGGGGGGNLQAPYWPGSVSGIHMLCHPIQGSASLKITARQMHGKV